MTAEHAQAIRVHGLEKSYKKLRVLRGVDFGVARGSIFALLGSNGAGKTTVVKILSTLLRPDAGTATVDGFDVATQRGRLLLPDHLPAVHQLGIRAHPHHARPGARLRRQPTESPPV